MSVTRGSSPVAMKSIVVKEVEVWRDTSRLDLFFEVFDRTRERQMLR